MKDGISMGSLFGHVLANVMTIKFKILLSNLGFIVSPLGKFC